MRATLDRLSQDANKLQSAVEADENASQSRKKRAKEAKRLVDRMKKAIEEGRIEEDIKGVKIEKVFSRASTKQAMVARVSIITVSSPHLIKIPKAPTRACPPSEQVDALWILCRT